MDPRAPSQKRIALGLVELSSIARGIATADALLKEAEVELLLARTVCSGKYVAVYAGEVDAVERSTRRAEEAAAHALVDSMVIADVHPDVLPAIRGTSAAEPGEALGVVESFSVAALVEGADAACKEATIVLLDVRLAMALGGKAYAVMTGALDDVRAGLDAAVEVIARKGLLVDKALIPNPRPEVFREIV